MCIEAERVIVTQFTSSLTSKHIFYEGVAFISNLVHTTHFMNDLHQGRAKSKHWKANYLIKIQPKTNRTQIGHSHQCPREENVCFNNNFIS